VDVTVYKLVGDNRFEEIISAKKAKFVHGETWRLLNSSRISGLNENTFPISNKPDDFLINLGQKSDDLSKIDAEVSTLHPFELARFIKQIKKSEINASTYEIQLYEKFSRPILCIIFALLPILGFSSPNRRNAKFGKTVTFTLLFCVLYWLSQSTLQAMGNNNKIPSFLSVFSVPLIFIFFISYGIKRQSKLS
jgi:lipopolysaccharide export LptBFGC system permease protein LptF